MSLQGDDEINVLLGLMDSSVSAPESTPLNIHNQKRKQRKAGRKTKCVPHTPCKNVIKTDARLSNNPEWLCDSNYTLGGGILHQCTCYMRQVDLNGTSCCQSCGISSAAHALCVKSSDSTHESLTVTVTRRFFVLVCNIWYACGEYDNGMVTDTRNTNIEHGVLMEYVREILRDFRLILEPRGKQKKR